MEYTEQQVRNAAEVLLRSTEAHSNQNVQTPNLDMCKFFFLLLCKYDCLHFDLVLNSLILLSIHFSCIYNFLMR